MAGTHAWPLSEHSSCQASLMNIQIFSCACCVLCLLLIAVLQDLQKPPEGDKTVQVLQPGSSVATALSEGALGAATPTVSSLTGPEQPPRTTPHQHYVTCRVHHPHSPTPPPAPAPAPPQPPPSPPPTPHSGTVSVSTLAAITSRSRSSPTLSSCLELSPHRNLHQHPACSSPTATPPPSVFTPTTYTHAFAVSP